KKQLLAVSALALAVMSGSAQAGADSGDIEFLGVVTDTTCDIVPEVGGAVNNIIQLGSVTTSTAASSDSDKGSVINFALKPKAGVTCNFGANTNATFTFTGNLGAAGLTNQSGTATDAIVTLKSVNANTPGDINSTTNTAVVAVTNLNDAAKGAQFSAQLIGGATAGDYRSAVAYVVSYN
ncbi:fimbrial protein PefA, partial [Salmonella enterica]|nr:fimbrial protein PefA [Salmonella enterica]